MLLIVARTSGQIPRLSLESNKNVLKKTDEIHWNPNLVFGPGCPLCRCGRWFRFHGFEGTSTTSTKAQSTKAARGDEQSSKTLSMIGDYTTLDIFIGDYFTIQVAGESRTKPTRIRCGMIEGFKEHCSDVLVGFLQCSTWTPSSSYGHSFICFIAVPPMWLKQCHKPSPKSW